MAGLNNTGRYAQQPQQAIAAQSHGLVHLWALNVAGERAWIDSTGGAHGTFGSGVGSVSGNLWLLAQRGYFVNFDNSGTGSFESVVIPVGNSGGSGSPGSNVFTIQARIRIGVAGTHQTIYGAFDTGLQFRVNTSNQLQLLKAGVASIGTSSGTLAAGVDYDVAVTYNGSTANFFINGVASGSGSSTQSFVLNTQYAIGNKGGGTATEQLTNGSRVYYLGIWNRVRPIADIASFAINPWQVYPSPQRRLWNALSAEGGATAAPLGVSASSAVGSITASGQGRAAPVGVSSAASVGTASASGSTVITGVANPAGVSAASVVGTTVARGGGRASAVGVSVGASVGTATASGAGAGAASPAGVSAASSAGAVVATAGARVVPAGVMATASIGQVIASGTIVVGATAFPIGVQAIARIGAADFNSGVDPIYISPSRTVNFDGGTNRVTFDGGTNRVDFDGGTNRVDFDGGTNEVNF